MAVRTRPARHGRATYDRGPYCSTRWAPCCAFEPPAPRLRARAARARGVDVGEEAAGAAIRAEIAYYRAHLHEGATRPSLAELRDGCAEAMRPALPARAPAGDDALDAALLDALRFTPYDGRAPTLRGAARRGVRLVVVSNWDVSLHERLAETGLAPLVDGAVASAEVGAAKPDPAIFAARARARGRGGPARRWHVGDSPEADVAGALAAGVTPVLVARDGEPAAPGVRADLGARRPNLVAR